MRIANPTSIEHAAPSTGVSATNAASPGGGNAASADWGASLSAALDDGIVKDEGGVVDRSTGWSKSQSEPRCPTLLCRNARASGRIRDSELTRLFS